MKPNTRMLAKPPSAALPCKTQMNPSSQRATMARAGANLNQGWIYSSAMRTGICHSGGLVQTGVPVDRRLAHAEAAD